MNFGRVGIQIEEDFTVVDTSDNLVTGIDSTSFVIHIFSPNDIEVSSSLSPAPEIIELGYGNYRLKFTPNIIGTWFIQVLHSIHFPWGKISSIKIYANDIDTVSTSIDSLIALASRTLGLTQENFYIDTTSYDSNGMLTEARIRTYTNESSVGTNSNILARYDVTATYDSEGRMETYMVKKI